ncbi:cupin domain-containing protein [uncultured Kiloniella sp.]|uniref:cupin domain-containing protein n=1 Tax=uncultured Kiloniella sp. TaxID=1133091 RepID=UPI0026138D0F|nr:cupin domain-containing protein [uncultured Kiloniella sp.]
MLKITKCRTRVTGRLLISLVMLGVIFVPHYGMTYAHEVSSQNAPRNIHQNSPENRDAKNQRTMLLQEAIGNMPGHELTAITVELVPENKSPAHSHETFVFVYVLEGNVRSKLGSEEAIDYAAGDSWIEPPGAIHTLTENLSNSKPAKLLAIFVGKKNAQLTTSGTIGQ